MNISYCCGECGRTNHSGLPPPSGVLKCDRCGRELTISTGTHDAGQLRRCAVCPSTDLFVRKDFPQRLGVSIVVLGFIVSCVFWYLYLPIWTFASLLFVAFVDFLLYAIVGDALVCYRCGATYRGATDIESHGRFRLETHEKHRQLTARLKS